MFIDYNFHLMPSLSGSYIYPLLTKFEVSDLMSVRKSVKSVTFWYLSLYCTLSLQCTLSLLPKFALTVLICPYYLYLSLLPIFVLIIPFVLTIQPLLSHMMRYSDCREIVSISGIRWISGNLKIPFQIVLIFYLLIVHLFRNFPVSMMDIMFIRDFSLWLP